MGALEVVIGAAAIAFLIDPTIEEADDDRDAIWRVRDQVQALAFEPTEYFTTEYGRDPSIVTITYLGDDYGWPVYSIAVAKGCLDGEEAGLACGRRLRARMSRAPNSPEFTRARQRGNALVARITESGARSDAEVSARLEEAQVEWLEADFDACPGAVEALGGSSELSWVPKTVSRPGTPIESLVFHADIVKVAFSEYGRTSSYLGYIADSSPAQWAVDLAEVLEPCWRPSSTPPPWRG